MVLLPGLLYFCVMRNDRDEGDRQDGTFALLVEAASCVPVSVVPQVGPAGAERAVARPGFSADLPGLRVHPGAAAAISGES